MGGQPQPQQNGGMSPKGGPQPMNQGWQGANMQQAGGQGMNGPGAGSAKGGGSSPYQMGMNSALSGLQSTAPMQYMQIQNMPPGPERDALIRQTQGSDNGAGFNAGMKSSGYQLNPTPGPDGQYTYNAPPGGGNTFTGGGSPGFQMQPGGMGGKGGGGGQMKGGQPQNQGWGQQGQQQGMMQSARQFFQNQNAGPMTGPQLQPQAGRGIG